MRTRACEKRESGKQPLLAASLQISNVRLTFTDLLQFDEASKLDSP